MTLKSEVFDANNGGIDFVKIEMWKNGIADFFRKVNSTLAVKNVPVMWVDKNSTNKDAVAYTDGETVFINPDFFKKSISGAIKSGNMLSTIDAITDLKGASYHELAHILWTPRRASQPTKSLMEISQTVPNSNILRAFNILEDQRIESRFVARYRSSAPYFIAMAERFITDLESCKFNPAMVFLLTHGRRFLGNEVRNMARDLYDDWRSSCGVSGITTSAQIADVIDEYRLLVFPRDWEKGVELVKHFSVYLALIEGELPEKDPWANDRSGNAENGGGHGDMTKGTPNRTSQQDADVQAVEEMDKEFEQADEKSDENGSGSGGEKTDKKSDDKDSDDTGSGSGGDSSDDDNEEETDKPNEGEGGSSSGSASQLKEIIKKMKDDKRKQTQGLKEESFRDLKNITKSVNTARRKSKPDLRGSTVVNTTGAMRSSSTKIRDAFITIKAEGEEVWERGMVSGRLNTGLAMNARGRHLDVFDQWNDAGDEALSFEIVLLIDQSGSMAGYKIESVSKAVWIIRDACQQLDIPVTVIGYDDNAWLIFSSENATEPHQYRTLNSRGGTNPNDALAWAESIFSSSQAAHKLLFSLTDGDWWTYNEDCMKRMTNAGVHTTLVVQGDLMSTYDGREKFMFPFTFNNPKVTYHHDRTIKIGNSEREFPALISKAIKEIAAEVVNTSRV